MRYMNLDKYRKFLADQCLYLSRIDTFDDEQEGTVPEHYEERIRTGEMELPEFLLETRARTLWSKQFYVSSWFLSPQEDRRMWQEYGKAGTDKAGVCIVSSYQRLERITSGAEVALGMISYVDYSSGEFAFWGQTAPFMHKRASYAHENEVRILLSKVNLAFFLNTHDELEKSVELYPPGYRLRCPPSLVAKKILVAPNSSERLHKEIVALTEASAPDLVPRIERSALQD